MNLFSRTFLRRHVGTAATHRATGPRSTARIALERLEDRTMPALIVSQGFLLLAAPSGPVPLSVIQSAPATPVQPMPTTTTATIGSAAGTLPPVVPPPVVPLPATTTTVSVLAPALAFSATNDQTVTLTATIGSAVGAPNGGTVTFNVAGVGTLPNVAVSGGVAQSTFAVPRGTLASTYTVTATYAGTAGFSGSTSSGAGNGILTFCQDGLSTLLGPTLQTFAVLAGSTVTNTGSSTIVGEVGVSPGSAVTGFPPGGVAGGTIHSNDAVAVRAQAELTAAYNTVASEPFTSDLTGRDLGGLTLTPGVYHFDTSAFLTGTLTLNAQGNPNARFDFQIGSTLITAPGSSVLFINGGADNVYWQVGSSATLDTSTVFAGNILALTSITLNDAASIGCGKALARNGAVTMINNFIDPPAPSPDTTDAGGSIRTLYGELLGRNANDQEVAYWVGVLQGPTARMGVVAGIGLSPEGRDHLVQNWYENFLGRAAAGEEELGWVRQLLQGRSEADVLSGLLASSEFAERSGRSDEQFVRTLSIDLLNRPATEAEVQGWVGSLGAGGRQAVAGGFLNSREFRGEAVFAFYNYVLNRLADEPGFRYWLASNLDVAQIRMRFLSSGESVTRR